MATFLLIVIYASFIGLGLPDSIFGSAWPEIYTEFNIPFSYGSFMTTLISLFTVVSSLLSVKIINLIKTSYTVVLSSFLIALGLILFSFAQSFFAMCILSIPFGLGAGCIDSALNNYVAIHYKASHMNFLHAFYGLGVMLTPLIMHFALSGLGGWRLGYRTVFYIQLAVCVVSVIAIPFWEKVKNNTKGKIDAQKPEIKQNTSLLSVIKMRPVRIIWLIFIGSCAVEFTCGNWLSTYFVEGKGVGAEIGALVMVFYYAGMTLGRFVSGLVSKKLTPWRTIYIGQGITLIGIILVALPISIVLVCIGIGLIGFGNGPVFPNLAHLTPINFGEENSQAVMGTQMTACYVGVTIMPLLYGMIAKATTVHIFPWFLIAMYTIMALGTGIFSKLYVKKSEK